MRTIYSLTKWVDNSIVAIADSGDNSLILSSDGGQTWKKANAKLYNLDQTAMNVNNTLYIAQTGGKVLKTADLRLFQTITIGNNTIDITRAMCHSNGSLFFGAGQLHQESLILKSTNDGKYKAVYKHRDPYRNSYAAIQGFQDLGNGVILATENLKILRSSDGGESWNAVFDLTKLNSTLTTAKTFAAAKNGTVYVSFDSTMAPETKEPERNQNSQIWYSEDRGVTWRFHSRIHAKRCF